MWNHTSQAFNVEETIAISSQMMNRNNFRIVLEEILKVNDIKRRDLPEDIDDLDPDEQVRSALKLMLYVKSEKLHAICMKLHFEYCCSDSVLWFQVRTIMSVLPPSLLQRGKAVTDDIIQQVKNTGERKQRSVPLGWSNYHGECYDCLTIMTMKTWSKKNTVEYWLLHYEWWWFIMLY